MCLDFFNNVWDQVMSDFLDADTLKKMRKVSILRSLETRCHTLQRASPFASTFKGPHINGDWTRSTLSKGLTVWLRKWLIGRVWSEGS